MNSRCKNCTHWKKNLDNPDRFDKWGGGCESEKFTYEGTGGLERPRTDDMLVYGDYEGYSADFDTGPEFGCIHFERR
jgi:hypothetical protein